MTNEDERWNALTDEQRAFLLKLGRWPARWFVSDARYASTWARMEKENRLAAKDAEAARQRAYWVAVAGRVTNYTGPDYRVRMVDGNGVPQKSWVRVHEKQYNQALDLGLERNIGIPEPLTVVG